VADGLPLAGVSGTELAVGEAVRDAAAAVAPANLDDSAALSPE